MSYGYTNTPAGRSWFSRITPFAAIVSAIAAMILALVAILSLMVAFASLRTNQEMLQSQEKSLAEQRALHREDIEMMSHQLKLGQQPFLAVDYCCNPVPVAIDDRLKPERIVPYRENDDPDVAICRNGQHFVAQIRNYGSGPALEVEVFWVPDEIVFANGKTKKFTAAESNRQNPRTWPAFIQHGGIANINHLPTFLTNDLTGQIKKGTGHLMIVCNDQFGHRHEFKHEFTFTTRYESEQTALPAVIGFHFYDHEATPKRHSVAKPPMINW